MTMPSDNRRVFIDKQHPQVYRSQIEVAKAVRRAARDAGLSRALMELVNLRVSQINACAYCLHTHTRDAIEAGESPWRITVLPAWRDTRLFTDQERAALTLAESLTVLPDSRLQDRDYAEAASVLTHEQISVISWAVIVINAFNLVSVVSRHSIPPEKPQPTPHGAGGTLR
ncbi:carboxymuconolactone decarboxylase family protein [Streptomyces sp. NPDC056749]|uniref:carboxymuconolactone decarboxylase family protein n=1 Tax=Streptomyces sp. NPDC056749 TaxID=3345936 RepID=UPI003677DA33